jgi:hypothetical protein
MTTMGRGAGAHPDDRVIELSEVVNLCPHEIELRVGEAVVTIPSSGLARCAEEREELGLGAVGDTFVPLVRCRYGEVTGLPEPRPGTLFVVSHLVAQQLPQRRDLVVPDRLVRDERGVVVAAQALAHL